MDTKTYNLLEKKYYILSLAQVKFLVQTMLSDKTKSYAMPAIWHKQLEQFYFGYKFSRVVDFKLFGPAIEREKQLCLKNR